MDSNLENYFKNLAVLFIALLSNSVFANTQLRGIPEPCNELIDSICNYGEKCCLAEYQKEESINNLDAIKKFFGYDESRDKTKVAYVGENSVLSFASDNNYTMKIPNTTIDPQDNSKFCNLIIQNGYTLYIQPTSTLRLGPGGVIDIIRNGKLFISGDISTDKSSVINVGDKTSGGWFILNATKTELDNEYMLTPNMTINLLNKDSHVDIHGNEMYFPNLKIYKYHPDATVHIRNANFTNKKFNPFAEDTDKYLSLIQKEVENTTP